MGWLAFLPLLLFPQWLDWAAWQGIVAALGLCIAAGYYALHTARWQLSSGALPWLLWPLFLFAWTPAGLELFSEAGLRLIAMSILALLIFTEQTSQRFSCRLTFLACGLILAVQLYGIATRQFFFAQNSVFAQENVYQFMNLLAMGFLFWQMQWGEPVKAWRWTAVVLFGLALTSLLLGDTPNQGKWEVSSGKSIGVWLGLLCGLLAAGGAWVHARLRLPGWTLVSAGAVVVLLWALTPILMLYMSFWNAGQNASITSRLVFWQAAWNLVQDHLLSGVGYGALGAHIQDYWPPLSEALFRVSAYPIAAHSHQLHVWTETGVVGWLWSVALWGTPWLYFLQRYTKERNPRCLFWVGYLAALQSAMLILEVTQMFIAAQLGAWLALLYASRAMLSGIAMRKLEFRSAWVWLLLPLALILSWDRGLQLYSRYLSTPTERMGKVLPEQVARINQAVQTHARNAPALYYIAELHRFDEKYDQALKAVDALQEISGTQWPVHRMRAEIYHAMGDRVAACQHARWPLQHSIQQRDQALRTLLQCE